VGNVENISLGPGTLYVAQVGSTAPTNVTSAWAAAWKEIGYTSEGTELTIEVSRDPVEVAEELDPVAYASTARSASVAFAMAELTARNLTIAFNGGTVSTAGGVTTYVPPELGAEGSVALGFESEDGEERWIFSKASQSGSVSIGRRKGADKATVPVTMNVEKVTGQPIFTVLLKDSRSGGTV
jgi:hypothetical protein